MSKEILHITAIDKDGNLIHINDAKKGKTYNCPSCKKKFTLRKSGKTGKGSKRPHFAVSNRPGTSCWDSFELLALEKKNSNDKRSIF